MFAGKLKNMENSTYILVPSGGGQHLHVPVVTSSISATATFAKMNSGHAVVMSTVNNAHGTNLTAGKSVLNVRTIGPNLVSSWKPGEAANRPTNAQTHPVRFIVASSKDGLVNVPNFASLASGGGTQGATTANPNNAAANNSRVTLVRHSSAGVAGVVQKIAPAATAAVNFSASVPNRNLRATIPGGNKMPGRTVSFGNAAAAVVPKTAGAASSMWGALSVANSTMTGSTATAASPSKQVIIQLAPEQLSFLTGSVTPAPGASSSRLSNSTPVPASYFTPVSNNNNSSSGPAQFVRVVTSNAPIQPKLLPGSQLMPAGVHAVANNSKATISSVQTGRPASSVSQLQPVTTQRLILPAAPQLRPSIAPSNIFKIETHVASAGAGAGQSATAVGQPVTFIGQPGFAFQPSNSTAQRSRLSLDSSLAAANSDSLSHSQTHRLRSWTPEAPTRPRKPCNCNKSQCLKLYCECFANGEFCNDCNCCNCFNNLQHEEERSRAVKACLDRNPHAFHPKIGKGGNVRQHCKGCNCKRSGCLKNYCECYEAKIPCSRLCRCVGCKNFEESPDRQNLLHLADAAEVRVQQQAAAETKLAGQLVSAPVRPAPPVSGAERPAYTFLTLDVIEAMCSCLIAEAEDGEQSHRSDVEQERRILTEFGRCLTQVIDSASRTRAPTPMDQ